MMLHCDIKDAAVRLYKSRGSDLAITNRLRKQAARCAALAKQTHDDEARQRYLRLEQMYLQMAESEERADSPSRGVLGGSNLNPAA